VLEALSRRRLLRAALGGLAALGVVPSVALAKRSSGPTLSALFVRGAAKPFTGDRSMFVTVAPGVVGRDLVRVNFSLDGKARVRLDAVRMGINRSDVRWTREATFPPGSHALAWRPAPDTPVGSYVMRLTVEANGGRRVYGGRRPPTPARAYAPVVRVLGVEAAFTQRSYLPKEPMALRVQADAASFTLTFLRVGHGPDPSQRTDEMTGLPMGNPVTIDWAGKRSTRRTIVVQSGDWPSGLYAAKLETEDGRVGFAPFVLRPTEQSQDRVAVILPTNTWQAYNLYDSDGDGWGDTWYAGGMPPVMLDRPFRERGVPPRFFRYDFPFLRWLEKRRRDPDFFADDDLERFPSGDELRRLYDLVVFPGHSEYMTEHAYNAVERFRDLGGRLIFLSANNFFWKVEKQEQALRRVAQWRTLGRPEARLCGVQYRTNDDGTRQGSFYAPDVSAAPWLFEGTGLENGDTIGDEVGGFGIEIDTTTPFSPPGTKVLAVIPNLFGPGLHAEMAYYETEAGARVFSAGVLDFPAVLLHPAGFRLMDNLWRHMVEKEPPETPAPDTPASP
jgi:hypothetical protein